MGDREAGQPGAGLEIFDGPPVVPDPAPRVAPSRPEPAHPVVRAFAFTLDGIGTVGLATAAVLTSVFGDDGLAGLALVVPIVVAVVATLSTALLGVTGGKALVGIRVVRADTGGRPGLWAIPRSLVIAAPPAITWLVAWALDRIPDREHGDLLDAVVVTTLGLPLLALPILLWIVLLAILAVRPRHRGLQDLAGRSVVVNRP